GCRSGRGPFGGAGPFGAPRRWHWLGCLGRLLFTELLGQTFISVAPPRAAEAGAADGAPTALWGAALGAAAGPASALAGTFTDMVQADKAAAADVGGSPLAAVGAVALVLGGAALLLGGDDGGAVNDKKVVKDYFNNEGFQRWQKIYGETDGTTSILCRRISASGTLRR
ncbi:unnamed protein product, partial [Prorocentrum cordatum]